MLNIAYIYLFIYSHVIAKRHNDMENHKVKQLFHFILQHEAGKGTIWYPDHFYRGWETG